VFDFTFTVTNIVTMMGLAVAIDYSLFIVSRYREERASGLDREAAIATAGATASRAVLFSGMTVFFALLGMLIIPATVFRRHPGGHRRRLRGPHAPAGTARSARRPDRPGPSAPAQAPGGVRSEQELLGTGGRDRQVERIRARYVPEAFPPGIANQVLVGGDPALNRDFFDLTGHYQPIVVAFVLALSFLLLMMVFRSVVVPFTAILLNLLSVGAAYGLIVLVFQKGGPSIGSWLAGLFGFQQVEVVEAWLPLFLFSILFGLSMDYHVFLLSRIRERYVQSRDNAEAVAYGLSRTGGIITGAALIMVAVFAGFASGQLVMFQQMGFGLAVAVLLDATIIRSVLVPATMKVLGDRNWYLPSGLRWLPRLAVEPRGRPLTPAPPAREQQPRVPERV
jgi:uncharacterized membrane protein YdfJ with MMPL/SSD domain